MRAERIVARRGRPARAPTRGRGRACAHNLVIKREPFEFATAVRLLLGYRGDDRADLFDTAINLAQTFWDPIEPMNGAPRWTAAPARGPHGP